MICSRLAECVSCEFAGKRIENCSNQWEQCILVSDCRSNIKCEENKMKYILQNTSRRHMILYRVDGGVVAEDGQVHDGQKKCDYLYVLKGDSGEKQPTSVMVELKGRDVEKALRQVRETLILFRSFFKSCKAVHTRIISSKVSINLNTRPEYVKLREEIGREYHGTVKISTSQLQERDIDILQ